MLPVGCIAGVCSFRNRMTIEFAMRKRVVDPLR